MKPEPKLERGDLFCADCCSGSVFLCCDTCRDLVCKKCGSTNISVLPELKDSIPPVAIEAPCQRIEHLEPEFFMSLVLPQSAEDRMAGIAPIITFGVRKELYDQLNKAENDGK